MLSSFSGVRNVPPPQNDPNLTYAPGTCERAELKARLKAMAGEKVDIPIIIGGKEIRTGRTNTSVMPHDHAHVLGQYHLAGPEELELAIRAAIEARREWASWPWEDRAAVLLRVADDGIGGADVDRGSGLRGLADRVEALGGRLQLSSSPGQGTVVRAEIPCA